MYEIERKWLVNVMPGLDGLEGQKIHQGYMAVTADGDEVRIRQRGTKFYETVKSSGDLARREVEIELTEKQFLDLWDVAKAHSVEKIRYELELGGLMVELDVYEGDLAGLVVAEVEFSSLRESESFSPPSWFGREVTNDRKYKNKSLAVYGLPGGYT